MLLPKDQRHPLGGQLLDAVAKRDSEDWLLAITTDHGGGVAMGLIAFVLVVDQPGIHDAFRFHPFFLVLFCFIYVQIVQLIYRTKSLPLTKIESKTLL